MKAPKPQINNLVAKHDHNRGGYHGKSPKAARAQSKQSLMDEALDELEQSCDHDNPDHHNHE